MLIPEIDKLLDIDTQNIDKTRKFFSDFDHSLPDTLNTAATIYQTCVRAFGQGTGNLARTIEEAMEALNVHMLPDLMTMFQAPPPKGQETLIQNARAAVHAYLSLQNRAALLTRMYVLYGYIVADFLRVRLTTPMACLR